VGQGFQYQLSVVAVFIVKFQLVFVSNVTLVTTVKRDRLHRQGAPMDITLKLEHQNVFIVLKDTTVRQAPPKLLSVHKVLTVSMDKNSVLAVPKATFV
jgi:hypothetical protein